MWPWRNLFRRGANLTFAAHRLIGLDGGGKVQSEILRSAQNDSGRARAGFFAALRMTVLRSE
jgi:hypothetical protein